MQNSLQDLRDKYIKALANSSSPYFKRMELADDLFTLDLTVYSDEYSFNSLIYKAFSQSFIDEEKSLHPEQLKIIEIIENNKASIISAPTSCGKTFCIFEYIVKHSPQNIVLIVPTLALIDEYLKKIIKTYKEKFEGYKIHTGIDENKTYNFNQKNIFILTHDRIVQEYDRIEKIDFLVIDEVYKLKTDKSDDRVLVLNMAYYHLAKKANKYVLLAPFINSVEKISELEKKPIFYKTNYSPVVNQVNVNKINKEDDRFLECLKILRDLKPEDKTLIYFPTVSMLYKYVTEVIEHQPIWSSPPAEISNFLHWAKEEIHEDWCVVKALERGYLIHNGQIPVGSRMFQLDCYGKNPYYNRMLCTATLLEGVNTSAKNIIIVKPSRDSNIEGQSFTAFDFYNLVGRTGRLNEHYIGDAYYIKSDKDPEFQKSDADTEIIFEISDISKDIDIQKEDFEKHSDVQDFFKLLNIDINEYRENIGTKARFETVKQLHKNYVKYKNILIESLERMDTQPRKTSRGIIVSALYLIINGSGHKLKSDIINALLHQRRPKIKDIINKIIEGHNKIDINYIISLIIKFKNGDIEHSFYNKSSIIKFFMQKDSVDKGLIKILDEKILEPIEYLYFSNNKHEKMLLDLGIYERDIDKIIKVIGDDFDDAVDLSYRLINNLDKLKNISYMSKYVILNL